MFTPERIELAGGYQLCCVCGHIITNEFPCWVLRITDKVAHYVHTACEKRTDRKGKKKIPLAWKPALKQPETLAEKLKLVEHYQREKQYSQSDSVAVQGEYDKDDENRDNFGRIKKDYVPRVNEKNLLLFFYNEYYQQQSLQQADVEHRVLNTERCKGKSAYCLDRHLKDIEEEAEQIRKESNTEARRLKSEDRKLCSHVV